LDLFKDKSPHYFSNKVELMNLENKYKMAIDLWLNVGAKKIAH
jgi:hypothetical protein